MDKIRIGNDIIVNWDITRLGKPGCVLEFDRGRNIEHTSERL